MSQEAYDPCPCGSGKKVKFCCAKNLGAELEPVLKALSGEQRMSALEQTDRLLVKHPSHPALLALQAECLLELGEYERVEQCANEFVRVAPDNPTAHALQAILAAREGRSDEAVRATQRGMSCVDTQVPQMLYVALGITGQALLGNGKVIGARAYFTLQVGLTKGEDRSVFQRLTELQRANEIPLSLKYADRLTAPPEDASWADEAKSAILDAHNGKFETARQVFEKLTDQHAGQPDLTWNLALLLARMGREDAAAAAFRAYGEIEGVPLDDAVEAEALAQILGVNERTIDRVELVYPVTDPEKLLERMAAHRRLVLVPEGAVPFPEGAPPPKALYMLMDREPPASQIDSNWEDVPVILGTYALYGKQTDRPAQVEARVDADDRLEETKAICRDIGGEFIEELKSETTFEKIRALDNSIGWKPYFSEKTPNEVRVDLTRAQFTAALRNIWTELPLPQFNGKSAREAAADPHYRIRVLASILVLEHATEPFQADKEVFNRLREELQLPQRELFDLSDVDLLTIPPVRLPYINVGTIPADKLEDVVVKLTGMGILLSPELRQHILDHSDQAELRRLTYEQSIATSVTSEEAMKWIEQARKEADERNESKGFWYIQELGLRVREGNIDEVSRLVKYIQDHYAHEPEVMQALMLLLYESGLISRDQAMGGMGLSPPRARTQPAPVSPAAPVPTAAPAAGPAVWTPGDPPPAAAAAPESEEKKSKLWLPGMD